MYDPAHPFGKKRYDRAIIDPVSCTGCGYCTMFCVMDCILLQPDGFYTVDLDRCIGALRPTLGGERYLTDRELSERLKISRRTLQEYRSSGGIPYYCVCGKVLYRESDIERVLEEHYFALP